MEFSFIYLFSALCKLFYSLDAPRERNLRLQHLIFNSILPHKMGKDMKKSLQRNERLIMMQIMQVYVNQKLAVETVVVVVVTIGIII